MITLEEMFNNIGLYDTQTYVLFSQANGTTAGNNSFTATEDGLKIFDFFFPPNDSIRSKCKICKQANSFSVEFETPYQSFINGKIGGGSPYFSFGASTLPNNNRNPDSCYFSFDSTNRIRTQLDHSLLPKPQVAYVIDKNEKSSFIIHYVFTCDYSSLHKEEMSLLVEVFPPKVCITKIGQEPDPSVLMDDLSGKYDSVLSLFGAEKDFSNALRSHSLGLSVGSCCYMRRVLEKIINKYSKELNVKTEGKRTSEIITELSEKGVFADTPKEMLSTLYSNLSCGIHELPDEKIAEYYETLNAAVVITLQDELNKTELEKTKKAVTRNLGMISCELSSKKQ